MALAQWGALQSLDGGPIRNPAHAFGSGMLIVEDCGICLLYIEACTDPYAATLLQIDTPTPHTWVCAEKFSPLSPSTQRFLTVCSHLEPDPFSWFSGPSTDIHFQSIEQSEERIALFVFFSFYI